VPPPFEHHIFICTNRRPDDNPKGSCAAKGAEDVKLRFKQELDARGLKGSVRANAAGCLDACERATIVEQHLIGGRPVERLLMQPIAKSRA
jgi:hypothetical protein